MIFFLACGGIAAADLEGPGDGDIIEVMPTFLATMLLFSACAPDSPRDEKPADTAESDADTDTDTDADTDADIPDDTYTVSGRAVSVLDGTAVTVGAVTFVDGALLLSASEGAAMAEVELASDGSFFVEGLPAPPVPHYLLGFIITGNELTPSASVVTVETVDGELSVLELGDVPVVTDADEAVFDDGLRLAGSDFTVVDDGALLGWVVDAEGAAVEGATVSCSIGADTFYADEDASDGIFSTADGTNAATGTSGFFAIPGAPVASYQAEDGGTHGFDPLDVGSTPGQATFVSYPSL